MVLTRLRVRYLSLPLTGSAVLALGAWAGVTQQDGERAKHPARTQEPAQAASGAELHRGHLEFRRLVEAAFRKEAGEGAAREGARDERAGGAEARDERDERVPPPAGEKKHAYETARLLITSLDSGVLVAGAPARSAGAGRDPQGRAEDAEAASREPDAEPEGRRALGAILIASPRPAATTPPGSDAEERGRARDDGNEPELRPVRARQFDPGFYLVRMDALGTGVELVDRDGRIRRTIPLTDHESAEAVRGDARPASFAAPEWEQVYGRILVWIAPHLASD